MKIRKKAFALTFLLILTSITQIAAHASERPHILILGDSLTAGYDLPPEEAYPSLLQDKITEAGLPHRVINAGRSGDTTAGGLRRVAWVLRSGTPDIAIVALGGNDGLRGLSLTAMKDNLRGIIHAIREANPDVILFVAGVRMPDTMGDAYTSAFAEAFAEVAEAEQVHLIPFLLDGVAGVPEHNLPDQIHPNTKGHRIIADLVWQHLTPTLPLRNDQ